MRAAGIGNSAEMDQVIADGGVGLFIRSLVGLDREAAKRAFAQFYAGKSLSADQIELLDMIIDHLTERGIMEPNRLYESPFTDLNPLGVEGVFGSNDAAEVVNILDEVRRLAAA